VSCRQYTDKLALLATGDLEPAEKRELEQHLKECSACRAELEELRVVVAMFEPGGADGLTEIERLRLENEIYRKLAARPPTGLSTQKASRVISTLVRIAAAIAIFALGYAAHPLFTAPGRPEASVAQLVESRGSIPENWQASASGLRLSPNGLRAIARGTTALAPQ